MKRRLKLAWVPELTLTVALFRRASQLALLAGMFTCAPVTYATICKYLDREGNVIYSNVARPPGMKLLSCELPEPEGHDSTAKSSPPSAPSAKWLYFGRSKGGGSHFIRRDSIRFERKNVAKAWLLENFDAPQTQRTYPFAHYRSEMVLFRFDCSELTMSPLETVQYEGLNGDGKTVASFSSEKPQPGNVVPDSIGETALMTVCPSAARR